jgi:hypothetical protein
VTGGDEVDNQWLFKKAHNHHSQYGEDGILEAVLDLVGEEPNWCVEFGAWDGSYLSNTWHLIESRGFSAVLIEGDKKRSLDLARRAKEVGVLAVNAFVGFTREDGLDAILSDTPIPEDFTLLSIDVDGNDYHIWKAVEKYKPRIVVIEFNPTIPTAVEFVQPADPRINQGSSITSIAKLGKEKGYELVCVTEANGIFVRREFFDRFQIKDNSPYALRPDESLVTWIFSGFDGTVFLRGHRKIPWHKVPYNQKKVQQVARPFRRFSYEGRLSRFIARQYYSLKKRGWL